MQHFCTNFDHRYLPRGLALYQSLKQHCPSSHLWVLCMDRSCHEVLSTLCLPDIHLIDLQEFERSDEELLRAKRTRTLLEYYITCKPSFLLFILSKHPEVNRINYLDADLFFFSDLSPLFDEIADHSIAIIGHRFPPELVDFGQAGIYNAGFLSFRRDESAFACLRWWRDRCLEWCYDRFDEGRFFDQTYLDDWPARFSGTIVLCHKGANLAPWNLANYSIEADGPCVSVDGQPLIFFHFSRLRQVTRWLFDPNLAVCKVRPSTVVVRAIYGPYIRILVDLTRQLSPILREVSLQRSLRDGEDGMTLQRSPRVALSLRVARRAREWLHMVKGIFYRKYILVMNGHPL